MGVVIAGAGVGTIAVFVGLWLTRGLTSIKPISDGEGLEVLMNEIQGLPKKIAEEQRQEEARAHHEAMFLPEPQRAMGGRSR
jgi:hypothetical protein